MPTDSKKPLLRLNVSEPQQRQAGRPNKSPRPKKYTVDQQKLSFGPRFDRLATILKRDASGLQLKSDPAALAPERLLVLELRGTIQSFFNATRKVNGLEFIDEEELLGDELDVSPAIYLMVPDALALNQISALWSRWSSGQKLDTGFTPWRDVFATLRDIRVWSPQDRLREDAVKIIAEEIDAMDDSDLIRLEVELIFRKINALSQAVENEFGLEVTRAGGSVISRSRLPEIAYHAVLVEFTAASARQIIELAPTSIAGLDSVMHIRPQSTATKIEVADTVAGAEHESVAVNRSAILALLDGNVVAKHPLLAGALIVDDQFGLEPLTQVADRHHGTAMASLILHGDRNRAEEQLKRKVHVVPVLSADDRFPSDKLVIDLIYLAVHAMRDGSEPTAPEVLIVNLSLGNSRRPFQGKMSAWARLIDLLSYKFGILFVVSAGNHNTPFEVTQYSKYVEFESAVDVDRAKASVSALGQLIAKRRLLSPAESVNAITVGAANLDFVSVADRLLARSSLDPFPNLVNANPSSALGPGFANSVKPEVLMSGAKERLSFVASGTVLSVKSTTAARAHGLKVAAPPGGGLERAEHFTSGTSAAAALTSRTCHQIHDALEEVYGNLFTNLTHRERAALLKALLVHTAQWPKDTANLIKEVLGPFDNKQHIRQKDNVRRFLGYGLADPAAAIACADDRATFWASGILPRDQIVTVDVPIPICVNGLKEWHALYATLAWFTPVSPGRQSYRAVRLKLIEPTELESLKVVASKLQPDLNQSRRGTVFSQRWDGLKAPAVNAEQVVRFKVQREPDQGIVVDDPITFGFAVTFTMPGVMQIYEQVRDRLEIVPKVRIQ
jgi:Subtilase family